MVDETRRETGVALLLLAPLSLPVDFLRGLLVLVLDHDSGGGDVRGVGKTCRRVSDWGKLL